MVADIAVQVFSVISWLVLLTFLQLSTWPYLKKVLGNLAFPAAFPASLLLFTLITWYLGELRIPVQVALVPFILLFVFAFIGKEYTKERFSREWKWELLFLVCFLFMLNVRFVNPSISYAEKFMDHGFIASIMRDPVVPPLDPWFAGGYMNTYYYLGYWMIGVLGVTCGAPSNIVFNLALPTIFAVSAVGMYALGHLLLDRFRWLPLATFLIVNPSFVYEVLIGTNPGSLLWNSTRTIPNAINEYPLFSLLWGDVHPHLIGMFNQVFLIFLLVFTLKRWGTLSARGRLGIAGLSALSLGAMPLINTWDVIIYAPLMLSFGLISWHLSLEIPADKVYGSAKTLSGSISSLAGRGYRALKTAVTGTISRLRTSPGTIVDTPWGYLLVVPPLSVLFWFPFYFQIRTQGIQGIGIVPTPTGPAEFLLVHGIFIVLFIAYLSGDVLKRPYLLLLAVPFALTGHVAAAIAVVPLVYLIARWRPDPVEILAIAGLVIIIFCEFFYLKDNMGDVYYRMNTVFKFYFAAWLMMGASAFAMMGRMISPVIRPGLLPKRAIYGVVAVLLIIFVTLPLIVPVSLPNGPRSLDGLAYIQGEHPGDAKAVDWLRSLPGNITIVEAENGDYTYFSRISSFTGIPTVIGWPFHEFMWRGDTTGWFETRMADVRQIYEDPQKTVPLMKKYNASLLYVGESELSRYQVNLTGANLKEVYNNSGVRIFAPGT
jgi:YYY domain-containing protein